MDFQQYGVVCYGYDWPVFILMACLAALIVVAIWGIIKAINYVYPSQKRKARR